MHAHDMMIGVLTGCVCLVFGLVPGLFDGLSEGIRNFRDGLLPVLTPRRRIPYEPVGAPAWMAVAGACWIAFVILAYLW